MFARITQSYAMPNSQISNCHQLDANPQCIVSSPCNSAIGCSGSSTSSQPTQNLLPVSNSSTSRKPRKQKLTNSNHLARHGRIPRNIQITLRAIAQIRHLLQHSQLLHRLDSLLRVQEPPLRQEKAGQHGVDADLGPLRAGEAFHEVQLGCFGYAVGHAAFVTHVSVCPQHGITGAGLGRGGGIYSHRF
jgi:hypothetical protein